MKLHVVALRDIKNNAFGPPQVVTHLGGAIRTFADNCEGKGQNIDPVIATHPEDFEMYQLGWYDDSNGEFTNEKQQIAVGGNYVKKG